MLYTPKCFLYTGFGRRHLYILYICLKIVIEPCANSDRLFVIKISIAATTGEPETHFDIKPISNQFIKSKPLAVRNANQYAMHHGNCEAKMKNEHSKER